MRPRDHPLARRRGRCTARWHAHGAGGNPGSGGSVILLVLMTLMLTAFAMTKYLERTTVDLLADSRAAADEQLRVEAYSALQTVLAVLAEFRSVDGALRSPAEGWGHPLEFAGYTPPAGLKVGVSLEDESGKISLPHADFQTLENLFILLGQKQTDAERLADALMVWMQKDYTPVDAFSARAADYEREDPPCDPPGRSLHSFAELASIKYVRSLFFDDHGQPNLLWHQFVDSVSLFDFTQPDINAARETTLGAVGHYDPTTAKVIADYLDGLGSYSNGGPAYFRSQQDVVALVGPQASSQLSTQVSCLRVNVTVSRGTTSFRLSAVVAPPGGARLPPPDPPIANTTPGNPAATTNTDSTNNQNPATPSANGSATTTTAQPASLNYPFTLLEIRENDRIVDSASSPSPATE